MVSVVYHKDGTPQCSQCNTGYEDEEGAKYCCTSCVNCGFRQHGMHERAQECCPCFCPAEKCFCDENELCCQDYVGFEDESDVSHAEWHHSNTACHECGSDDVDYTKVYYCSQCGEDDLVPGEQCSCGNLVGSKDYYEQMICGDCDNAWIEDDYSAEDEYIRCDWCNKGIGTLEDLESGSVEYLGKGGDIVCMTCVTKRGIPYDVSHAETFEAPRKTVSVSRRKKNNKISKTISDIMHSWEKTGMIGKNRPRSRKSAQKMAIAVAYSINNRKTTKKAEEGNTPIMPPMDFGEMAKWRPLDGTPGLKRNRAEGLEKESKLWVVTAMAPDEIWAKENQFSHTVRVFDNEINAKKYFNELMLMNGSEEDLLDSPKDDWEFDGALIKQPMTDGEDLFVEVRIKELSMSWDNGEVYRAENKQ